MEALALAHAYVVLDRGAFDYLQRRSELTEVLGEVQRRIKSNKVTVKYLEDICTAGAEAEEVLWILVGCDGLPGFHNAQETFGWDAKELRKALEAVKLAASAIDKIRHYPFGLLVKAAPIDTLGLPERLRTYVELARAAQRDFGHGAEWFLNIAKARLVIHVTHWTKAPHDPEVSGLIAAVTGTVYNAEAQRRWRNTHKELIEDRSLDPYTIQTPAEREQNRRQLDEIATENPGVSQIAAEDIVDFVKLIQARFVTPPNR